MDQRLYSREQNAIQKQAAFHCAQVLAGVKASNILITKMKSLLAELNMRYFNSANRSC